MKKLLFTAWLLMLSMVAAAQSFVVVDKNGNRKAFDVSKLDSVTFQQDPPAFTVYENKQEEAATPSEGGGNPGSGTDPAPDEPDQEVTTFAFDEVQSLAGNPDFLFSHPDTVYVDADGQDFSFQLRTNIRYGCTPSADWLAYKADVENTDSLLFAAAMNPMTAQRIGYLYFASSDDTMRDTLVVVQLGKPDSRYIAIDWSSTTLDSFDETSGKAQLTFTGDVPVMGDYDVVLLPQNGDYTIRLIDKVQQAEGSSTVTLDTRQGLMGNLFKNQKFTLTTETGAQSRSRAQAYTSEPVYQPTKVEIFTGEEYVEVYNANKAAARGRKAPVDFENEFFSWEYNQDGAELWLSGLQSLSWDKLNFNVGLKGLFSFDFGDVPFEKVRMGDLQHLKIALEGGFDMEMVLKYLVSSQVEWKKEWTLKEDVFQAKYTFVVGTVPVYISVGADLMAEVSLGASGEASITSGIKASNTVTYGVEWDAKDNTVSKIAECEKSLELVGPDVDIKAHATVYPQIEIGIYKVLCPTISPQPYIKAEADGRLVDNQYVAWNAGVSTGIDLGLGLSLDLFFWEWQLADIDPINVFDVPLVSLPDEIKLLNEPEEEVLIGGKREVKYHVTNKINLTGQTYNAPGVLVHFEAEGGELEDEYGYTDQDGNVSAFFTLKEKDGGLVKAEVVLGAEGEEAEEGTAVDEEDGIKADDWKAIAIDHRLTPTPASQEIEKGTTAAIIYKLERYTSKTGEWTGFGGQTIDFEATGGTVAPTSGVTAQDGTVAITFTPEENATEGKVTGSTSGKDPDPWGKVSSATVKVKEEGGGDEPCIVNDPDLQKANQLDNAYVVKNTKTGETQTRSYHPDYSEWKKGKDFIDFQLNDEVVDAEGNLDTKGMLYGHIPLTMTDVVLLLTGQQFENTPGAKVGFGLYDEFFVSTDFMCTSEEGGSMTTMGEIKPDGKSKMMIRQPCTQKVINMSRAPGDEQEGEYTDEYELLYYLVFTTQAYNPETQQTEEMEFEVYGKGTMKMHVPSITSFVVNTEKDWVKVGESTKVTLENFYEEGATWDWNDVKIIGQSTDYTKARNGENEGFFSWDAATQTLTSLKSNDNKRVNVCLGLISNPEVKYTLMINTGEGWKYTMIKTSQEEITTHANSYPSFSFDWSPKESEDEKMDFNALELDPDCVPAGYFSFPTSYANQGWPVWVSSNCVPGEYTLRFRVKSNHDVNCTMKFIITPEE